MTGFAFFRGDELRYLAFINFTGARYPVRIGMKKAAKLEFLTGDELLPSWNNPNNPSPATWAPKYEIRHEDVRLPEFSLERYSFSVVSVTMTP